MPPRRSKIKVEEIKTRKTRKDKGAKRKVTKRGAYKKAPKRQAQNSRKPFVEGKRRSGFSSKNFSI